MNAISAPPAASDTRQRLLDAALDLMLVQGYTATSVEEICTAAGLTKGSFFHYFPSKDDLAKATAGHYLARQKPLFDNAPFRQLDDPLERVFGRLDFMRQMVRSPHFPKSCCIGNFAQELAGTHPEIRALCENAFSGLAKDFARDLAEAKRVHAPRATFSPASVAELYVTVMQGSMILAKANGDAGVFATNFQHFRRYVEFLFGGNAD